MKHITTLVDYCATINIPPPKHSFFDIRRFEDNMKTVNQRQEQFRHEFYAIALKRGGGGSVQTGFQHTDMDKDAFVFFNSPFQLLSWDIAPNWEGVYIMFTEEFISANPAAMNLLQEFPYLRLDKAIPMPLGVNEIQQLGSLLEQVFEEYHSIRPDKFSVVHALVYLILVLVKRIFNNHSIATGNIEQDNETANVRLLSRFQTLIAAAFFPSEKSAASPHAVASYADQLFVHPNYLNAIVKRLTGRTAKQMVVDHVLRLAQHRLAHTTQSVKEIAFELFFEEATHFSSFFKRVGGQTPLEYRRHIQNTSRL
jgi:AraC family transcriptional regulator, transcriptional activator of pobA